MKIRFHLDENVSNTVADGLRRRGIDVTKTPEQGLISASDKEQLALADVTRRRGRHHFGAEADIILQPLHTASSGSFLHKIGTS